MSAPTGPARAVAHRFDVDAPLGAVFPLFTAEREAEWADGWAYEGLLPQPFRTETDAVFRTGTAPQQELWSVIEHDPAAGRVAYLAIWGAHLVRRVTVHCVPHRVGTQVQVSYTLMPLDELGAERARCYDAGFLAAWEAPVRAAAARRAATAHG